jgi:hypothetical protein
MHHFIELGVVSVTKYLSMWNVHYHLMIDREKIIKKLMNDVSTRCAERIESTKTIVHKPCEEFGISSILKKKRGL